ncbi:hypothetical protein HC928_18320 [bacterium]|nr:hypothetical protein [bacterium]
MAAVVAVAFWKLFPMIQTFLTRIEDQTEKTVAILEKLQLSISTLEHRIDTFERRYHYPEAPPTFRTKE